MYLKPYDFLSLLKMLVQLDWNLLLYYYSNLWMYDLNLTFQVAIFVFYLSKPFKFDY